VSASCGPRAFSGPVNTPRLAKGAQCGYHGRRFAQLDVSLLDDDFDEAMDDLTISEHGCSIQ